MTFSISLILLSLGGCARLIPPPEDHPRARALAVHYSESNPRLRQFKGLGNIRLLFPDGVLSGRLAWAGRFPDQLRMEWLTPLGQPFGRLIADGTNITLYSFSQLPEGRRIKQNDTALEPLIHIPIGVDALLDLLAGRLPLPTFAAARIVREQDEVIEVELLDRWSFPVAVFEIDGPSRQVDQMTVFASDGTMQYRIIWRQWQIVQGYQLPRRLVIVAGAGQSLELTLERCWCDVELDDATFQPDPYGKADRSSP